VTRTWIRRPNPDELTISFRQEQSQHPVGGMGGTWIVRPVKAHAEGIGSGREAS